MFPAQTIHRWGYGTGCLLFALESPKRLLCSHGVQNALGDRGEESSCGDNSRGRERDKARGRKRKKGIGKKGSLLNMMSV